MTRQRYLPSGWYPSSAKECEESILFYTNKYKPVSKKSKSFSAIVPHAGWFFSGKLACQCIYELSLSNKPDIVVVFGGHLGIHHPVTILNYDGIETPFGAIKMDTDLNNELKSITNATLEPDEPDNTIEIQLPFIKYFFPNSKLVALRLPISDKSIDAGIKIAEYFNNKGLSAAAFGSTDLTHYGFSYGFNPVGTGAKALDFVKNQNDKAFLEYAQDFNGKEIIKHSIEHKSSCSPGAAAGAISFAQTLNANKANLIDYYTSYDISPNSNFVGYGGLVYSE